MLFLGFKTETKHVLINKTFIVLDVVSRGIDSTVEHTSGKPDLKVILALVNNF